MPHSDARIADARIASEALGFEVSEDGEHYIDRSSGQPVDLPIPAYSQDEGQVHEFMKRLRAKGWGVLILGSSAVGTVSKGVFRRLVYVRIAPPGGPLATALLSVAPTAALAVAEGVIRCLDDKGIQAQIPG